MSDTPLVAATASRKPPWLTVKAPTAQDWGRMKALLQACSLATVCQEAHCPNMGECFHAGVATFLVMGRTCTRQCRFCAVQHGKPAPLDPAEPDHLVAAVQQLGLRHVVVTSVTRDDLRDGGAQHLSECIRAVHRGTAASVEALVPDFGGNESALATVLDAHPEVLGHNVEVVPRLYHQMRSGAGYERSLNLLQHAKELCASVYSKSGLMVGVGEREDEVVVVLQNLRDVRCDLVTIGQYLQPSPEHYPLVEYIRPEVFKHYGDVASRLGFGAVASGPLVRSSHRADRLYNTVARTCAANKGSQTS
jgi:lipoyl synthase